MAGPTVLVEMSPGVVAVGTPWVSPELALDLSLRDPGGQYRVPDGFFSLDTTHTGGSLTAEVLVSNGGTFKTPEGAAYVLATKPAGSYLSGFDIPVCRAFKVKITATGSNVTVSECIVGML